MVRKIGQLLLNAYGGVGGPNTFPLSKHGRSNLKIIFTNRCPKDVPTNTKLVWNNSSPHREEKPIWCAGGPPLLAIRGLRSVSFQILSTLFISAINLNSHKKCTPAKFYKE